MAQTPPAASAARHLNPSTLDPFRSSRPRPQAALRRGSVTPSSRQERAPCSDCPITGKVTRRWRIGPHTRGMSDVRESTTNEIRDLEAGVRWSPSRIAVAVVVGLLFVWLGYAIGVRTPWTAHHPRDLSGTAERIAANVPLAYFDPDDGERVSFRLDDVVRSSGDRTGTNSVPPCLREMGQRVAVQVGLIEVTRPFGSGSYRRVLSVTCSTG